MNVNNSQKKVLATPYARKLAAKKQIDLQTIKGSGFNGRILAADLDQATSQGASSQMVTSHYVAQPFSKPITPMRKAIAKAMRNSVQTHAYTNLVNEVNLTKLWTERKALVAAVLEKHQVKISFTALIALATIQTLKKYPLFNSKLQAEANVLATDGVINLGIAVDTPKGLVVPNIKNAESKSLVQIAQEINALAQKARDGKLTLEEMSHGTFTITNFGTAGAMWGAPVINTPELAILGVGSIVDRVYADQNGHFYNGKVMNLTIAADHQWIDGADLGRFTMHLKNILENPILLLGGY